MPYSFLVLVLSFLHLLVVDAMSRAPIRRSDLFPSLRASAIKLSEIKDARSDGISYEWRNVLLQQYLERNCPSKTLADLSEPGHHKFHLEYSNSLSTERSDTFLKYIGSANLSRNSAWEVEMTQVDRRVNWTLLSDVIEALPTISTLRWTDSSPIPVKILTAIQSKHPTCRLYYSLSYWTEFQKAKEFDPEIEDEEDDDGLAFSDLPEDTRGSRVESIMNSTALYSFKVDIDEGDSDASKINIIHQILTTCPNIRELDLNIARPSLGFRYKPKFPRRENAFDFSTRNESLPPLEVLTLRKYDLDSGSNAQELAIWETGPETLRWPWNQLPTPIVQSIGQESFRFVGGLMKGELERRQVQWDETTQETNLDVWMRLMDWTQIHTLRLDRPSGQLQKLEGGYLPNLKHVSFGANMCTWQSVLHFLSNVSTLESVEIRDVGYFEPDLVIDIITDHHCPSLTTLRLDRTFLNSTHLAQLQRHCPNIRNLDLNFDRTSQWDYNILDALASFSELRSLTLRFDLRRDDRKEDYSDPILGYRWDGSYYGEYRSDLIDEEDESVLLALKEYLVKNKFGERLETVQTFVGALEVPKGAV